MNRVSDNEVKFEYDGHKFLLIEQARGVYSAGRAIQLYTLEGFKKEHLKEIGWSKDDGHKSMKESGAYYKDGLINMEKAYELALDYVKKLSA